MTQGGLTLVETLLAVVVLFFLTSTMIPLTYNMKQQIADQKLHTHAAEVAFMGALKHKRYGQSSGVQQIDQTDFYWTYDGQHLCVQFDKNGVEEEQCI